MFKGLVIGITGILALSSCSTISHTASTESISTEIYNVTVADLDVAKTKVEQTADWNWTPLSTVSTADVKKKAEAKVLEQTGADVLVEPQYTVERRGLFRGGKVTVTGYPAKYVNFRSMSAKDAEVIATLEGRTVGVGAYSMKMAGPSVAKPIKPRKPKAEVQPTSFVAFLVGPCGWKKYDYYDQDETETCTNAQFNIMYGHYGQKWGWYGKIAFARLSCDEAEDYGDYFTDHSTSFQITAGAIKTLSTKFNVFAGIGYVSMPYWGDYGWGDRYFDGHDSGIAFEAGIQWHPSRFNLLAGVTYGLNVNNTDLGQATPFVGIGFSF